VLLVQHAESAFTVEAEPLQAGHMHTQQQQHAVMTSAVTSSISWPSTHLTSTTTTLSLSAAKISSCGDSILTCRHTT
jgi:hypothetical protein